MKMKHILAGALALAFIASAHAQTEIIITGASAFRAATLDTIKAGYLAEPIATRTWEYAHDRAAGQINDGTRAVFRGKFNNIAGTTTIRTNFTGSVEGVRALVNPGSFSVTYLQDGAFVGSPSAAGTETPSKTSPTGIETADFAFSDVAQSSTPVTTPALLPANPKVGIVTFTMLRNEGSSSSLTNITTQQFRALFSRGFQPLSLFTGVAADTQRVFAFGRNDGSGTRTTYLAETGYGITKTVNQYQAHTNSSTAITVIQLVPEDGGTINGVASPTSVSTLWGNNAAGNGGYNSGSALRGDLAKTSASVQALDEFGDEAFAAAPVHLVTFLATSDAFASIGAGAVLVNYNGQGITPTATGFTAGDVEKIQNGRYTLWSYENLYYAAAPTGAKSTFYTFFTGLTGLSANLGNSGVPLTGMNVSRQEDGGIIQP